MNLIFLDGLHLDRRFGEAKDLSRVGIGVYEISKGNDGGGDE